MEMSQILQMVQNVAVRLLVGIRKLFGVTQTHPFCRTCTGYPT